MIIVNYDKLLREYASQIKFYAQKLFFNDSANEVDDNIQEIRLYIYQTIDRFDPSKSSLSYYIRMLILTAYRKLIYDRKKQDVFEGSFSAIVEEVPSFDTKDRCDEILLNIVQKLEDETSVVILHAMLFNKTDKSNTKIAKFLKMDYGQFSKHVNKIRKITKIVIEEMEK